MQYIENKTFDEIRIGDSADLTRTLRPQDIELFAVMSGDVNPAHIDADYARDDMFHRIIAHGMWGGALISAVLGTELPGPGSIFVSQSLRFDTPVGVGDTVKVHISVTAKDTASHRVTLDCTCTNQAGQVVIDGVAEVIAPTQKLRRPRVMLPEVHLHERGAQYDKLIKATHDLAPVKTAVVHPCDALSLTGAVEAAKLGLVTPILIGPRTKIEAAAAAAELDLTGLEIIDVPHSHAAAARAVELVRAGGAAAIMKGKLHTDELMSPIIDATAGLRTERRMSHIYVLDVPHYPKPLFITDAAINIVPDLWAKRDIVQNAIDLAHALGVAQPKVAILSAVETVTPKIASTMDAASLCKMADRGQITGGLIDGPLAFDNAISTTAAREKGIVSTVAGEADILVVPDLEAGNMIAKQLIYLAGAEAAGIVIGARVPVILTSRSDGTLSRLASCALAQLFIHHHAQVIP
ncbi:MAG: bifunctional enoyl-CoA hydratase/phosphate acetyltransferase [Rhodobacteraceae bacterium]|jgi:phosphotransacetylase/acyl dehydratase|nr:bifunctional enoyl-CoA hydratase/phosphate acetyltransferase [Paracoccaceae bacterium]